MEVKDKEENTLAIEMYISWKNKRFALKDFIKETLKEIEDNKKRIDKAIEYIGKNDCYSPIAGMFTWRGDTDELINILRGEEVTEEGDE